MVIGENMKKVIVVSSSPRKGGNSETLANSFAKGARDAGNEVKQIFVRDIGLQFCIGCNFCQTHNKCVLGDKMDEIYKDIETADVLVFASPVYYYSVCGQLKTFLDRLNPLFPRDNKFSEIYLLSTAAEADDSAFDGSVSDIQSWIDCFSGVELKGVLRAGGVTDVGEIDATDFPNQAYQMGKNV